jgi:hypothetical protein
MAHASCAELETKEIPMTPARLLRTFAAEVHRRGQQRQA